MDVHDVVPPIHTQPNRAPFQGPLNENEHKAHLHKHSKHRTVKANTDTRPTSCPHRLLLHQAQLTPCCCAGMTLPPQQQPVSHHLPTMGRHNLRLCKWQNMDKAGQSQVGLHLTPNMPGLTILTLSTFPHTTVLVVYNIQCQQSDSSSL